MRALTGSLPGSTTDPAPTIECFVPDQASTGIGLVIFPGGGYGHLAEHEGIGYAEHFRRAGIACFVVSYRLGTDGHRHPAMIEDAFAALRAVRLRAPEFGVDASRIGVMGSSAGGHLAAHSLVAWPHVSSDVALRPDFGVLCYPVILATGPHVNAGSITNLGGEDASPEVLGELSCERHVTAQTPPCFLWHTVEDPAVPVENSMAFASALRRHNVPFELHVYTRGGHGLGLGTEFDWGADCLRWIRETVGEAVLSGAC